MRGGHDPYANNREGAGEGLGAPREGTNGGSRYSEQQAMRVEGPEWGLEGEGGEAEDSGILETRLRTLTLEAELEVCGGV